MITPHGGTLINRLVEGDAAASLLEKAAGLPSRTLNSREISDLEMITVGAMSPWQGFMGEEDYNNFLENRRMADGTAWPLPVVLATKGDDTAPEAGTTLALKNEDGTIYGTMDVTSVWTMDKERELDLCFSGSNEKGDHNHPT